ncbi:MAG TPA: hypothetical protein VF786_10360 [Terriglobales bacterium]
MKSKLTVAAMFLALTASAFAAQTTVTGVLTDDMCTKKHMGMGKTNADCVRECIKHGAKYAVVSGGKTYIVSGDQAKLNELAGKKVKVTGDVKGTTLAVASIEAVE